MQHQSFLRIPFALLVMIAAVAGAACLASVIANADQVIARSPAATDEMVNTKLRAAVVDSLSKLGELEPWQKKLFDEEAVPQYQRFILNYRAAQTHSGTAVNHLAVDIDLDSLKNYLRFYAPKTLGRAEKDAPALVYLRQDNACEKCVAAGPALRKLVKARLERRGLKPVWLTSEDLEEGAEGTQGKALDQKVAALAARRNAAASLVVQWNPAPVDDIDTAHADEKRYLIHTFLQIRGLATPDSLQTPQNEGHMELIEGDNFETFAARLLTDAFTDMGGRAAKLEVAQTAHAPTLGEKTELALEISGIRDFAQMTSLKAQMQAKVPAASFEERRISRGHAVFAVVGEASAEHLKSLLSSLTSDGVLQMEIHQ